MAAKIGVIGSKESVLPFQLFGFQVCYATAKAEVTRAFQCLVKRRVCGDLRNRKMCGIDSRRNCQIPTASFTSNHLDPRLRWIPRGRAENDPGKCRKAVGQNIL